MAHDSIEGAGKMAEDAAGDPTKPMTSEEGSFDAARHPDLFRLLDSHIQVNPHCAQLRAKLAEPFLPEALLRPRALDDAGDDDADGGHRRFVSASWPRMKYWKRPDSERSSCHWGQLKLFECELRCLTDWFASNSSPSSSSSGTGRVGSATCSDRRPLVVYVGAAPGRHVPSLVRRFPQCCFELYDPADFDAALVSFAASEAADGRVRLVQGFFDEEACATLSAKSKAGELGPILFFSDIRTADEQLMDVPTLNDAILRDMERQRQWVEILRPEMSVLKFRLAWGPGRTSYLRGRLLVQAFPPCTSTETRLVVLRSDLESCQPSAEYDHEEYEQRLMHHNTVTRACIHELGLAADAFQEKVPGLDRCFDCAALVDTVRRFVGQRDGPQEEVESHGSVLEELSAVMSEIGGPSGRTLAMAYHKSSSRHAGRQFARRRYTDVQGQDRLVIEPVVDAVVAKRSRDKHSIRIDPVAKRSHS